MAEVSKKFSPVRMSGKTEEAAIQQALMLTGASLDDIDVEVLDRTESRVTVRVSPRSAESAASTTAPAPVAIPEPVVAQVHETAPVAFDEDDSEDDSNVEEGEDLIADVNLSNGADVTAPTKDAYAGEYDVPVETVRGEAAIEDETSFEDAEEISEEGVEPAESPVEIDVAAIISESRTPPQTIEAEPVASAPPVSDESRERARLLAQDVLDHMGLDAQAELAALDGSEGRAGVSLVIQGEDVGILIGKHGATLQSFQYMINLMLNNGGEGSEGLRVVVDAGGYRARRAGALEQIARDAAARAKRDRRSVRLEPMPAYERRLVHMALQGDGTVATSSEGAEPMRHVVVTPAGADVRPAGRNGGGYGGERSGGQGGQGGGRGFSSEGRGRGGFGGFNGRSGPSGGQSGGRRYGRGGR